MKLFGASTLGSYTFITGSSGYDYLCRLSKSFYEGQPIVLDLETTGLDQILDDILLCAFTLDGIHAYVVDVTTVDITPLVSKLNSMKVANHNINFDYGFIKSKYGVDINVEWDTYLTYSLATAGLPGKTKEHKDSGGSLSAIASRYLNITLNKSIRDQFSSDNPITDETVAYAADDVLATWALVPVTASLLNASGVRHVWEQVEKDFVKVLVDMHLNGINFDMDRAIQLRDAYQERLNAISQELDDLTKYEEDVDVKCTACRRGTKYKKDGGGPCDKCNATGFIRTRVTKHVNFSSSKQVIEWFKRNNISVPTKLREDGTEMETVDSKARKSIDHPIVAKLDEYSAVQKVLSGFLNRLTTPTNVSRDGYYNHITSKVHPGFTQLDTTTGRLSSYSPNIQNQKRDDELRSIFVAPPGHLMIMADYSQYEVRVLAEISQDQKLLDFFRSRAKLVEDLENALEEVGEVTYSKEIGIEYPHIHDLYMRVNTMDFHNETAIALFKLNRDTIDFESPQWKKMRNVAKSVSFAIPYGAGPRTVSQTAGVSEKEASLRIQQYFSLYPGVEKWLENIKKTVSTPDITGVAVRMGLGSVPLSWSSTILGRRRFFLLPGGNLVGDANTDKKILAGIQRQGGNFPIQGVNADVIKLVLTTFNKQASEDPSLAGSVIRMTIHDEIVVSCPKEIHKHVAKTIVGIMKSVSQKFLVSVPTEVGVAIGTCWKK